ncbi:MAG: hypothetical protein MUE60_16695, partial [Candidatus Eisenbacteria bacterium]|nr:hypothetical protein [Candidatus Eisenbacteria bacterium]
MRIWAALLLLVWSAAEGQGVAVVYTDGRPPVALTSVVREGVVYHRLDEYASSLNGVVTWIPARRRAAMITGRDSVAVTV